MPATVSPVAIGGYIIDGELGRGTFGTVYRAHSPSQPYVPVALKVVRGRGDTDRLLLEPAVLSQLDHPCIVGLEDYFLDGSDLVLVLEFIDGKDLNTLLEEGERFTQADIRDLLLQIGSALAAAHERNIVHRDLKPANILVTKRPEGGYRFVLTDFGIGQVREGLQSEKHTGGTYLFMAPEQLRGRPGTQSDLWALGVVAYRLLTGRVPFPGPTLKELTRQILYAAPAPPSEVCTEPVEPELERAVLHLLDKSLQERTGSAEELLRELGHRGSSDAVLRRGASRDRRREGGLSLDRRLLRGMAWRKAVLVLCVAVYLLPNGPAGGLMLLGGMAIFFVAQRGAQRDRPGPWWRTLLAYGVLGVRLAPMIMFFDASLLTRGSRVLLDSWNWSRARVGSLVPEEFLLFLSILTPSLVLLAFGVVLPVVGGSLFAGLRRLQREKLLRDLAREGDAGSDRYLEALREALDSRFEDVGLHLKYAEALFARGRVKEAAVEARLLLQQDPYHFNGNLLLANAYYSLGLYPECVRVCDDYLAVSGYCFEFGELQQLSQRREAA
jgi:serine/threonine-protein kinase